MKKGFTTIELVVALAITFILLTVVFSLISVSIKYKMWATEQSMLLSNFKVASYSMLIDIRNSSSNTGYGVITPEENELTDVLLIRTRKNDVDYYIKYYLSNSNANTILKKQWVVGNPEPENGVAVTDNLRQIVKLYFVRQSGKVVIILVAYNNTKKAYITYSTVAYARNTVNLP